MKRDTRFAALFFSLLLGATATAEVKPPYNAEFPKARYPYAQAPDGCSSISNNPQQVRDSWGAVDFRPACDAHDECYYTKNSTWKSCNESFRLALTNACRNDLRTWVPGIQRRVIDFSTGKLKWVTVTKGSWAPPEPATLKLCTGVAHSYYTAVQAGIAVGVFNDAQKLQKKYEDWIQSLYKNERKYALTCIANRYSSAVNYDYRWGSGAWKTQSLPANSLIGHHYPYGTPGKYVSPELQVRFDRDFTDGTDQKTYRMRKFASASTDCYQVAQRDTFKAERNNDQIVDLYHNAGNHRSYDYYAAAEEQGDSMATELNGDAAPTYGDKHPGDCALESSRFENKHGGCFDRASGTMTVFSAPKYQPLERAAAFDYCEELVEGGYDDWSLPGDLSLQAISGRPFESHFTQPKGAANQSNDRWEFWSLSIASARDSGTVILRCLDEDKLGDGEKCSETIRTRMTEERYTICARLAEPPS